MGILSDKEIRDYQKQVRSGVPEGEVKEALKRRGCGEEEIAGIFKPGKYDMRSWYLFSGIVFFLPGLWAAIRYQSLLLLIASGILFYLYHQEQKKFQ